MDARLRRGLDQHVEITVERLEVRGAAHIAVHELRAGTPQFAEVPFRPTAAEVVEEHHLASVAQERTCERPADESGAPGDEDPRHCTRSLRYGTAIKPSERPAERPPRFS